MIASGVRDWGLSPRYPVCPNIEKVHTAFVAYNASFYYIDIESGRKCPEWFAEAVLTDLHMEIKAFKLAYSISRDSGSNETLDLLHAQNEAETPLAEAFRDIYAEGLLDHATAERAREELAAWRKDARAFHFWACVFMAGRA